MSNTNHKELSTATFGAAITRPEALEILPIQNLMVQIQSGQWRKPIEAIRKEQNPKLQKEMKQRLPYFVFAEFDGRREESKLIRANGIVLDLDHLSDDEIAGLKELIPINCHWAKWLFRSPVDGLKIVVPFSRPVTDKEEYARIFTHLREKIWYEVAFAVDNTPDMSRACFVSWDEAFKAVSSAVPFDPDSVPESGTVEQWKSGKEADRSLEFKARHRDSSVSAGSTALWTSNSVAAEGLNERAGVVEGLFEVQPGQATPERNETGKAGLNSKTDPTEVQAISAVEYLAQRELGHRDWIRCGIALYNHFGEDGIVYWLQFAYNPHYTDTPEDLRKVWAKLKKYPSVGIGTLFYIAEREGWINAVGALEFKAHNQIAHTQEGSDAPWTSGGTGAGAAIEVQPGQATSESNETGRAGLNSNAGGADLGTKGNSAVIPGTRSVTRDPVLDISNQNPSPSTDTVGNEEKRLDPGSPPTSWVPGVRDDTSLSPSPGAKNLSTVPPLHRSTPSPSCNSCNSWTPTLKDFPELLELFGRPSNVPLDRSQLPDFLCDFLDTVGKVTDAQDGAKLTAFLPVVGANIGNRIYMANAGTNHYCNIWAAIIGPSTVSRKSTVINQALKMLAPFKENLPENARERNEKDIEITRVTQARLFNLLALDSNRLLLQMELASWMQDMNKTWNAGMKQDITDMFDGRDRSIAKMEIDEHIRRPAFSILGATTEDWFFRELKEVADQRGGFLQRFVVCMIQDIDVDSLVFDCRSTGDTDRELRAWDEPLSVFRSLAISRLLEAEPEAVEFRNAAYAAEIRAAAISGNDALASYSSRIFDNYWFRFCILLHLCKHWRDLREACAADSVGQWLRSHPVNLATARQAWYLCQYYYANTKPFLAALAENAKLDNERKVVRILQKAPDQTLPHSRLLCKSRLTSREFRACMESLIERQAVVCHDQVANNRLRALSYNLNPVLCGIEIT